jgi:hypothetical protein
MVGQWVGEWVGDTDLSNVGEENLATLVAVLCLVKHVLAQLGDGLNRDLLLFQVLLEVPCNVT